MQLAVVAVAEAAMAASIAALAALAALAASDAVAVGLVSPALATPVCRTTQHKLVSTTHTPNGAITVGVCGGHTRRC